MAICCAVAMRDVELAVLPGVIGPTPVSVKSTPLSNGGNQMIS